MTEAKPYISPPPEADGNYAYYLVGTNLPVRIGLDEKGRERVAEIPDKDKLGQLKVKNTMISKVWKDEDVREITKDEFIERSKGYAEYRKRMDLKKKPPAPSGLNR